MGFQWDPAEFLVKNAGAFEKVGSVGWEWRVC